MAEKMDIEYYGLKFFDIIKNNLNTKLAEINTRKDDGITLKIIDENAYYYLEFGREVPMYDPICVFQVDLNPTETVAGASSETVEIMCMLIISDELAAASLDVFKMTSRYRRAIEEIIEANQSPFDGLELIAMPDVPFIHNKRHFMAVGVGIRFQYAN